MLAALDELDTTVASLSAQRAGLSPEDPQHLPSILASMVAVDQHLRSVTRAPVPTAWSEAERLAWLSAVDRRVQQADRDHARATEGLIDLHGWFDIRRFGEIADQDGWILIQHAVHDPALQARALSLIEERVALGESSPARFAYLFDRVATMADRPQRFGTQGRCTGPGRWEPHALESPDDVDLLRREVGLGTLDAYRAEVASLCR